MMSSITYSLVTSIIDGVTSFLQLMDVQKERKNMRFSPMLNARFPEGPLVGLLCGEGNMGI